MPADLLVRPAHLWVPEHTQTTGPEAAELCDLVGLPLDAEQRLALDAILAVRGPKWAAFEAAVICARQNLKTHLFKAVAIADICLHDLNLVVWTAHEFNTAMEAFRDMKEIVDGSDYLRRRVKRVTEQNGEEGFEFLSGQRIRFKARTKAGGRGLTGDRVFLDEAFALQPSHMGSLLPTMAAKSITGNPQVIYGSSAGQVQSGVLRSIRDRGRRGDDPSLVYLEWCAPEGGCVDENCTHVYGIDGCVLDDVEAVRQANPALERRISIELVQAMRRSLPPEEFAREFLGWWDEPAGTGAGIDETLWAARADRSATIDEPCVLGVDVSPGHLSGSIVTCGGAVHVTAAQAGTGWIVPRLVDLDQAHKVSAVVLDPASPAGALIPDLERAGYVIRSDREPAGKLVLLSGRDVTQACESFLRDVVSGTFVHRDEPQLNAAVAGAVRRQTGDSWKWSRRDSTVDISTLVAATFARFVYVEHRHTPQAGFVDLADYLDDFDD